jgi:hypothetical protein
MPTTPTKQEPSSEATYIFKGTVEKLKAATMKNVPVDNRTVVVRVDQVIEAPKNLADYAGKDITVQLSGRQKVRVGQGMVFHTNGWIFGDSVAVQSVRQEAVKKTHAAMLSRGGDPVEHKANRELRKRFDEAHLVVSGKVAMVRLLDEMAETGTNEIRAASSAEAGKARPVSEHDPKWREAVIEVDNVHKGTHATKTVVVRFPASTDVRWYKAPKFHPGQRGYFIMRKTTVTKGEPRETGERAMTGGAEPAPEVVEAYTCLHPADFQPYGSRSKALIELAPDQLNG